MKPYNLYNKYKHQTTQKIAVALGYDPKDVAPRVLAHGTGSTAEKILLIAEKYNIPLHNDPKLAQILRVLEINAYIPIEVYAAVAQILSHIYKYHKKPHNKN